MTGGEPTYSTHQHVTETTELVPVSLHEVAYDGTNGREIMENLEKHNAAKIQDAPEFDVSIDPATGKPIIRVV